MKFKAKVSGLIQGLSPVIAIAQKGVHKEYPQAYLVTIKATQKALEVFADGGHVSASNEINDLLYGLDYVATSEGAITVNAVDLHQILLSFSENDVVVIELHEIKAPDGTVGGREISISLESDVEQVQTIPVQDLVCELQTPVGVKKGTKLNKITLRRDLFINYANKIMFAHGDMDQMKNFLYWVLRSYDTGALRFAAGTGSIFAIIDLDGANLSDSKVSMDLYFPNKQTQAILGVLNEVKDDMVSIESQDRYVSISCGSVKMVLYTCDPTIVWPDENQYLGRASKFGFVTKVVNWRNAVKGIVATNNSEAKQQTKVHNCLLNVDFSKMVIQARSESSLKSIRKIAIDKFVTNEDEKQVSIKCNSRFVNDIISKASDDEYIQFEIEDSKKPIVVRYYACDDFRDPLTLTKPNDDGIRERYSIIFATVKG